MKNHGMVLADIGGDWFVAGVHDIRWDDESQRTLRQVKWRDYEVVKLGSLATE